MRLFVLSIFGMLFFHSAGVCADYNHTFSWNEGEGWYPSSVPVIVRVYYSGQEVGAIYDNETTETTTEIDITTTNDPGRVSIIARAEYGQGPLWTAETEKADNGIVLPTAILGGGYIHMLCTTAGTTGLAEPTWSTTAGDTVTDGTVVWTVVDSSVAVWQPATAYGMGGRVYPSNTLLVSNKAYECSRAGTSGSTEPDWLAAQVIPWWGFWRRFVLPSTNIDDPDSGGAQWNVVDNNTYMSNPTVPILLELGSDDNTSIPVGRSRN